MKLEAENKIRKLALLALTTLFGLFPLVSFLPPASAAGARLHLSPSEGTYYIGSYFSVGVLVNTEGNTTNAYKAVLAYPSEKLSAVSVSSGGSICSLWIAPSPSYSNTQNTATFECGTLTAYKGSAGRIGKITFVVKSAGTATVSISKGQVKKADGKGTEILSARGSASFNLQEFPTNVPVISSSTHPDQNAWYQSRTIELSWSVPEGTDGFSYLLSRKPGDVPDNTSEGAETSKTYADLADGTWYFHLKAHDADGWSPINHFRIQIDNEAPEDFEIVSDPSANLVFRAPLLSFATVDKLSGIDHYEISINGGEFGVTTSPYRFDRIKGGIHTIIVRAVDRAGNTKDSSITLNVIGVSSPTIVQPTEGESIPFLAPLNTKISVTALGIVELSLDGQLFATLDSNTGFEHTYRKILLPKEHRLSAVFVNADGIESEPAEVKFRVNPMSVYLLGLVVPGYIFYPILVAVLAGLALLARKLVRKWRRARKRMRQRADQRTRS
jgi:hypothetical protein